ncbi:hypothetical protein V8E53_010047 [Lactarius tabidus]
MMRSYESVFPRLSTIEVSRRMARARESDNRSVSLSGIGHLAIRLDTTNDIRVPPTLPVNFVLLRFLRDTKPLIVHQFLSARPTVAEILWNFARYTDHRRITLSQNPHFALNLTGSGDVYKSEFSLLSSMDSVPLKSNDTIYVITEQSSRSHGVFFHTGQGCQIFASDNVWVPGDTLIFKDGHRRLKKGRLLRCDTFGGIGNDLGNDQCDPLPVTTTPSANPATSATSRDQLEPLLLNIHVFGKFDQMLPLVSSEGFACPCELVSIGSKVLVSNPPPPTTSEQPSFYQVLYTCYTAIDVLNDDILLVVFNHYRLDDVIKWNARLGWCKLSHVCQRWRHLVHGSSFHLGLQILCTNGTPLVDTLVHLPPFPLVVDYQCATATICAQDQLGIFQALHLRDRLRHVVLRVPPLILDQLLLLMDEPFPVLEHLSLSSSAEGNTILLLPKTLLAPNLRHLTLLGIGLPNKLLFLSLTLALVTLTLTQIQDFGYFSPQHLIARLRSFSQLEELSIGFSIPLPRPSAERKLLQEMEAPVTLPLLKRLTFRGVSAYLDSLVAQIRAPLLEQLNITLFNQIHFALPHLSHFTNTTEGLKLPVAKIIFKHDGVSMVMEHGMHESGPSTRSFRLDVFCKEFDWQIDCAAQICSALVATLTDIEQLTLDFQGQRVPAEWRDGAVDSVTWRELLGPFVGAKKLFICHALALELSCAFEWAEMGSDPGLLPCLEELSPELEDEHANNAFVSFVETRRAAGRPVLLPALLKLPQTVATLPSQSPLPIQSTIDPDWISVHASVATDAQENRFPGESWAQRVIIKPLKKRLA